MLKFTESEMEFLMAENCRLRKELQIKKKEICHHIERKSHYEDILYNMRDAVERERPDYTLSFVNKAYCEFYGVKEEEILNTNAMEIVYEADRQKIQGMLKRVTPENPDYRYSCRVQKRSGEIVWVETEGRCFFDEDGNVVEYQEVGRDISQHQSAAEMAEKFRLQMEEKVRERTLELSNANAALSEANSYLQTTLNNISEGVITIDSNGKIKFLSYGANAAWSRNEKFIREKLRSDLHKKGSLIYNLIYNKEEFQDNEVTFPTPNKDIQCLASAIYLDLSRNVRQAMLILEPLSEVRHLVNRMSGAQARFTFSDIIGSSTIFRETMGFAKKIAASEGNVIIEGESGTGKELFAQSIHNASPRKKGPFIAVNCGAIPRDLIGSELFGYVGGAFTGAKPGGKPGKFEMALGGTIFLDEIGEMPLEQQVTLLRVLQERAVTRIGGDRDIAIDVRVICATNKNLMEEVQKGNFRQDLYYRLNVINLYIPPLRQRKEDIPLLCRHFAEQLNKDEVYQENALSDDFIHTLQAYHWPGNVRELQNTMERTFYVASGNPITPHLLPSSMMPSTSKNEEQSNIAFNVEPSSIHYVRYKKELEEKEKILGLMKRYHYNCTKVAKEMKISRTTLYRKLEKYQIDH